MPKRTIMSQKVKKISGEGHSHLTRHHPYWGGGHPSPNTTPSAPAAPRPIFANPAVIFLNSHTAATTTIQSVISVGRTCSEREVTCDDDDNPDLFSCTTTSVYNER